MEYIRQQKAKVIVLCGFIILVALAGIRLLDASTITIKEFEHRIWELTNQQRDKYHLPLLAYDEGLADLARLHSRNMQYYGFFDHKDQSGDWVSDRHRKYYSHLILSSIGENLARFYNTAKVYTPEEIVEGWMNSPEHRKNMLDPDFTHLGVGVVNSKSTLLATQNFATEIAMMNTPIPKKISRKSTLHLEFTYLSPRPWQSFSGTLIYPDPEVCYQIDNKHYCMGSEPVKITWLDETRFGVDLQFNAGKGSYYLNFGFNGGYYSEGIKLRVK